MNHTNDEIGLDYQDGRTRKWQKRIIRAILPLIQRCPGRPRILDAGCGSGAIARELISCGYVVEGIELSESGLAQCRTDCPGMKVYNLSLIDPELYAKIAVPYDIVISVEVIEHLVRPAVFVENCRKILKSDGLFILTTPYHGYWKNLLMALTGKMDVHFQAKTEGGHIKFWSKSSLISLLEDKGFKVLHVSGWGRFPPFWKSLIVLAGKE